jgi:hypothetical protein
MKKFLTIVGLLTIVATPLTIVATPASAQAYCQCWGTGNVMDQSLLEKTNGAYGYEMSVPPPASGKSGYAYSPATGGSSRHMKHKQR